MEKAEDSQSTVTPTSLSSLPPSVPLISCLVPTCQTQGKAQHRRPRGSTWFLLSPHREPEAGWWQRSGTAQGRDWLTTVFMYLLLAPNSPDVLDIVVYYFEICGGEETIIFFSCSEPPRFVCLTRRGRCYNLVFFSRLQPRMSVSRGGTICFAQLSTPGSDLRGAGLSA